MKALVLFSLLFSLNSMASFDVCQFESTATFDESMEAFGVLTTSLSDDHTAFTLTEVNMIFETLRIEEGYEDITAEEALVMFGDYRRNSTEPGSDAGEIVYYKVGDYEFSLVHYWPGENEYGAFVELSPEGEVKILATISDQWITCKKN